MTPSPKLLKLHRLHQDKRNRDSMALVALTSLGLAGISLVVQLFLFLAYAQLARKPAPSLVQLTNGETIAVRAMGSLERDPAVVQRFVTDSLILLMSWHPRLPASRDRYGNLAEAQTDTGVEVSDAQGNQRRITTTAFQASFTFAEHFRQELVQLLAQMTPEGVFSGKAQTLLMFQAVTQPESLGPGRWSVSVVGHLVYSKTGSAETQRIPFNKQVIVRAVDTPPLPHDGALASPLEAAVQGIRQAGLEIEQMQDLEPGAALPTLSPAPSSPQSNVEPLPPAGRRPYRPEAS